MNRSKIKVLPPAEMRSARIRSSEQVKLMTPQQFRQHWKKSGGNIIPNPWGQAKGL